jgi:hypothetical protein
MNAPGQSIGLAVTVAIMVAIASHEASAHGGTIRLWTAWSHLTTSRAVAGTGPTGVLGRIRYERSRP